MVASGNWGGERDHALYCIQREGKKGGSGRHRRIEMEFEWLSFKRLLGTDKQVSAVVYIYWLIGIFFFFKKEEFINECRVDPWNLCSGNALHGRKYT